jgi:hypothetical protein
MSLASMGTSSSSGEHPIALIPTSRPGPGTETGLKGGKSEEAVVAKSMMWTAIYDYDAQGEDELRLVKGDVIEVLSKDH